MNVAREADPVDCQEEVDYEVDREVGACHEVEGHHEASEGVDALDQWVGVVAQHQLGHLSHQPCAVWSAATQRRHQWHRQASLMAHITR